VFRDKQQTCEAIRVLLRREGLHELWTLNGPSSDVTTLVDRGALSTFARHQRVVILAAFALWGGEEDASVLPLLDVLLPSRTSTARLLLIARAQGPAAVDRWLHTYELN
jgi:hypothetical protein